MAIATGDILRVAYRWNDPWDNDAMNVYHVLVVDRGTEEENLWLEQMCKDLIGGLGTYLTYIHTDYDIIDAKVDKVTWSGGKEVIQESYPIVDLAGYAGGGGGGEALPPGVSALVKWRTSGVKTQAKKYLPYVTETYTTESGIAATPLAALQDFADSLLDDITMTGGIDGTIRAVVHSFRKGAWVTLLSAVAEAYAGYQRRRRQNVGS